ncbi:AfsR/SARP family transcriptional regulator [Micromonospora deserti]|nr:BTAD domain-containing putative transcriptional regulator [Micromonospora deserti]
MENLRFRLMGPLEVWDRGGPVPVSGRGQQLLLAVLLLNANQVVTIQRLVDALWEGDPPRTAVGQIRDRVRRLRAALSRGGATSDALIVTRTGGYLLAVPPSVVDIAEFDRLTAQARTATEQGRDEVAASLLDRAIGLWRGSPMAGLDSSALAAELLALEERRVAALEERISVKLRCGRPAELVPELTELVAEHPLRERLWHQLMTALHACGRVAAALDAYRQAHRIFADELGIEPGEALRDLERAILRGTASPHARTAAPDTEWVAPRVPRQLPPACADLVDRPDEFAAIMSAFDGRAASDERRAPVLVVITGPPGAGKSTLAVEAAHALRHRYPAGQFFAELGGGLHRVPPTEIQRRFLRGLGVDGVPSDAEERTALYRTAMADRELLVVLDDAADEAQVRPLMSGCGGAVIVTSRHRLAGLAGAVVIPVGALLPAQAVELLTRVAGNRVVAAGRDGAEELAAHCEYLPLALRAAGARLAARPDWQVGDLVARMARSQDRLDELAVGDLAVRASLAVSYQPLGPTARRVLRRMGLLATARVPGWAPAALLDRVPAEVNRALDQAIEAHLLSVTAPGPLGQPHYRMHDLVAAYAAERAFVEETAEEREAALIRVLGGWLCLADRAARLPYAFFPVLTGDGPRWPADQAAPLAPAALPTWYDIERDDLLAAASWAVDASQLDAAWELPYHLHPLITVWSDWAPWRQVCERALHVARQAGDRHAESRLLLILGELLVHLSELEQARDCLRRAAHLLGQRGESRLAGYAWNLLGVIARLTGDLVAAESSLAHALELFTATGDVRGAAHVQHDLGIQRFRQGRSGEAAAELLHSLAGFELAGDKRGGAYSRYWLAQVHRDAGDLHLATEQLRRAHDDFAATADGRGLALVRCEQGRVYRTLGDFTLAETDLRAAHRFFRTNGDRRGEALALFSLGELAIDVGHLDEAKRLLSASRRLYQRLGRHPKLAEIQRLLAPIDGDQEEDGPPDPADLDQISFR